MFFDSSDDFFFVVFFLPSHFFFCLGGDMCVDVTCCGRDLDKKDGAFGKSDPFLLIYKKEGAKKVQVYKSDVIMKNLNPEFKPFELRVSECGGMNNKLIWEVCSISFLESLNLFEKKKKKKNLSPTIITVL